MEHDKKKYYLDLQVYKQKIMNRNQASLNHVLKALWRAIIYYSLSLFIIGSIILTSPFWIPLYFWFTSLRKSFEIAKALLQLPSKIMNPPDKQKILSYAILRGSGKYLKSSDQDVLIHQLYDYTARRFLTLNQIDQSTRLLELEYSGNSGLKFLTLKYQLSSVLGNTSNIVHFNNLRKQNVSDGIELKFQDYKSIKGQKNYDCILCFDLRRKLNTNYDLVNILKLINQNLTKTGYIVMGQFFEHGQANAFSKIVQACCFKIVSKEDLTKNMQLANKIIYKQRVENEYDFFVYNQLKHHIQDLQKCIYQKIGLKTQTNSDKLFTVMIIERALMSESQIH